MRISLNLATRPFTDLGPILKRLRIGMGVLVLAAGGLLLGLHFFHQKAEEARLLLADRNLLLLNCAGCHTAKTLSGLVEGLTLIVAQILRALEVGQRVPE